jgi:ribosomal-protein-alanine N-acetyltransferase
MTNELVIRELRDEDCAAVAALSQELFPYFNVDEERIRRRSERGAQYLVAEIAGSIIGFADFYVKGSDARLMGVGVAPQHRNKGIGTALLEAVLRSAKAQGIRRIKLIVQQANAEAVALYLNNGFAIKRALKKTIQGKPLCLMSRLL